MAPQLPEHFYFYETFFFYSFCKFGQKPYNYNKNFFQTFKTVQTLTLRFISDRNFPWGFYIADSRKSCVFKLQPLLFHSKVDIFCIAHIKKKKNKVKEIDSRLMDT